MMAWRKILMVLFVLGALVLTACHDSKKPSDIRPTGAISVLTVETRNPAPIASKKKWRAGSLRVDSSGSELDVLIRGRGNTTWERSEKRPYRIKFDDPVPLLGMNASKHFVLLSEATSPYVMVATVTGFELSRRIGMPYTPEVRPVELVLNNDYRGVYLLTEQVRVEPSRIHAQKWSDDFMAPKQGGWLLEIDGWNTYRRMPINSLMGRMIPIEYHYPKELTSEQHSLIKKQLERVDSAICTADKSSTLWEQYVDMDVLAMFYIVNEMMDNGEAFSGSCWISCERNGESKIKFGPVWDFGSAFVHRNIDRPDCFIYENLPGYCSPMWLREIVKFPRFQQCVRQHYRQLKSNGGTDLDGFIDEFVAQVEACCDAEAKRWPGSPVANLRQQGAWVKIYLKRKIQFLDKQWL